MLKHLSIKNYALIQNLDVAFHPGFSVITGETGAGKSIIMGAFSLIVGQRAELSVLMDKNVKCVVEGQFQIQREGFKAFFDENNLDFEPEITILRREILPSGKSRAFINDTPVNLPVLKELAEMLVDIHSQHQTTLLQSTDFQLEALDSYAGLNLDLARYRSGFILYKNQLAELAKLRETENKARAEQDFIQFQFDELEKSKLVEGEQLRIEQELEMLNHAGEIKSRLQNAHQLLQDEPGILHLYNNLIAEIRNIKSFSGSLEEIFGRIENSYFELKDVSTELEKAKDKVEVDPGRAGQAEERLSLLYHLEQKHRVNNVEDLIKIKDSFFTNLKAYASLESKITALEKDLERQKSDLVILAGEISEKRIKTKTTLEQHILNLIANLGMPRAQFIIEIERLADLTANGTDKVTFLFNANPGGELQEIAKAASGGELSRLMLAVKSVIADSRILSTIIFDEIDSGVSGEIAGKMGAIMQKMSEKIQIIAITHLPQIASRGKNHYLVFKTLIDEQTQTFIRQLPDEERIAEIAKMLSDATVSQSAVETARELLKN